MNLMTIKNNYLILFVLNYYIFQITIIYIKSNLWFFFKRISVTLELLLIAPRANLRKTLKISKKIFNIKFLISNIFNRFL